MKEKIKQLLYEYGAEVCGVANIDRFTEAPKGFSPLDIYADCKSVIVIGKSLPKGTTKVDSRLVYAHFNSLTCTEVDRITLEGARMLEKQFDAVAVPVPCDGPYDYWEKETLTGRGLMSMKHAAVLAGLGQLGKNTLLLNPTYGNLLTVGVILTNLDLISDDFSENICIKGCKKCIEVCPTHAIQEGTVNQFLCRPNTYGENERGFSTVECNKCRVVCPRKYGLQ